MRYTLEELISRIIENNKKINKELMIINVPIKYYIPLLKILNKYENTKFQMYLHNIFKDNIIKINSDYYIKKKKNTKKLLKKYNLLCYLFKPKDTRNRFAKEDYYILDLSKILRLNKLRYKD